MRVRIRVPSPLRPLVAGASTIEIGAPDSGAVTVGVVLDALAREHPALERRVRDEQGRVRTHVNLFVGADHVRDRDGLATPIGPGDELSILPAVSGG